MATTTSYTNPGQTKERDTGYRNWGGSLLLLVLFLFLPSNLNAQGLVEPLRPIMGSWIERVDSRVRVEIDGNVATVVVDEWFQAHGRPLGEADYLYPLPPDAVFNSFSLYQGEDEMRGEIMNADQAREIYEEIVRSRRDPALIELAGHGLLRARVFPLNPGETRRVTLRFSQILEKAGDALHLRYAGGVPNNSRCISGESGPPSRCIAQTAPLSMEIIVSSGDRFLEPFSPTHPLTSTREGSILSVKAEGRVTGQFSLFLPLVREGVGLTLATHKPLGEDGYFLLSLTPGLSDAPPQPRDLTVVLDVSGSMSGEKIQQAREALLNLLDTLAEEDRFRLIAFSNAVRPFNLEWLEARSQSLSEAREWVTRLSADGGTNISGALKEALRLGSPDHRLPVTIFLTDGLPTVGDTSIDAITTMVENSRGRIRVFSFGVGNDVNTALLDRMTEKGRGSTNYVAPGESVERALSLLATKIQHPVLTDLALSGSPVRIKDIYPVEIPDVFAGEELVLFGRYETDGENGGREVGELAVEGRRGGESLSFSLAAEFPHRNDGNDFLPRLWASRKLGFLTRRIWTEGESEELVEEIRNTALRYGIPSPYTSYLVLEPGARPEPMSLGVPVMSSRSRAPSVSFSTQGAGAVGEARRAKALRDVVTVAELMEAEEGLQFQSVDGGEDSQLVAGRLFLQQDGVWKDAGLREDVELLKVAPFSRAYFDLLERIPELQPYAREFGQLEVQGAGLRIGFEDGGVESLSSRELDEAFAAFRTGDSGAK